MLSIPPISINRGGCSLKSSPIPAISGKDGNEGRRTGSTAAVHVWHGIIPFLACASPTPDSSILWNRVSTSSWRAPTVGHQTRTSPFFRRADENDHPHSIWIGSESGWDKRWEESRKGRPQLTKFQILPLISKEQECRRPQLQRQSKTQYACQINAVFTLYFWLGQASPISKDFLQACP